MLDELGDRMKVYEGVETSRKLNPKLPIYVRLDGRGFSKFTRGMERPFDPRMSLIMKYTIKSLIQKTHAIVGYTQSDEISLLYYNDNPQGSVFFDGKIQKICSVLAGLTSSLFTRYTLDCLESKYFDRTPHFDCRVFQLPSKVEACNALIWREKDASRNAIQMVGQHYFSSKELFGKSTQEVLEKIKAIPIDYENEYPQYFRKGLYLKKYPVEKELSFDELMKIPEDKRPMGPVIRGEIQEIQMTSLLEVKNRIEVIFDGVKPELL